MAAPSTRRWKSDKPAQAPATRLSVTKLKTHGDDCDCSDPVAEGGGGDESYGNVSSSVSRRPPKLVAMCQVIVPGAVQRFVEVDLEFSIRFFARSKHLDILCILPRRFPIVLVVGLSEFVDLALD